MSGNLANEEKEIEIYIRKFYPNTTFNYHVFSHMLKSFPEEYKTRIASAIGLNDKEFSTFKNGNFDIETRWTAEEFIQVLHIFDEMLTVSYSEFFDCETIHDKLTQIANEESKSTTNQEIQPPKKQQPPIQTKQQKKAKDKGNSM